MKTRADGVVAYRNSLQARGLAAATINARLAAIRGLFSRSVREGEIPGNPADAELVPGLQVSQESRTEGLSLEEVQKILGTCDGTLLGLPRTAEMSWPPGLFAENPRHQLIHSGLVRPM